MTSVIRTLVHDRAAWIGTISSLVSTGFASVEAKNWTPQDLQGWLAAALSAVTFVYILVKTVVIILERREKRRVAATS